jgi:uroporphyrinogen decarboxylase
MGKQMTSRERFRAALCGAEMDRIPMYELGYWPATLERWRAEGLPDGVAPQRLFGLDSLCFFAYDGSLRFPTEVVEDDDRYRTASDADGIYMRSGKLEYATPVTVRTTITSLDDWMRHSPRLEVLGGRIPAEMPAEPVTGLPTGSAGFAAYHELCRMEGRFTILTPVDPIWYALRVLGEERSLEAIAAEPELIESIVEDYALFNERMLALLVSQGYRFDAVWVFSDLCYRNGLLFSPEFFRRRVMPTFRRYVALCHEAGSSFIFHCDGNVEELLPLLMEAGVDCMQPLEARAGNDLVDLVARYGGRVSFMGNVSADILSTTRRQIQEELERKLPPAVATRRYIFHSDHSIPPTVSLQNYAYAVQLARRLGTYP